MSPSEVIDCFRAHDPPEDVLRYTYGSLLLIITVASLSANIHLAFVMYYRPIIDPKFRPYIYSLIAAAIVYLLTNIVALIPVILFNAYPGDPLAIIVASPDTLSYLTLMFSTTTIAIDRFALFWIPKTHAFVTDAPGILIVLVIQPWFWAFLATAHMSYTGCHKRAQPFALTYTYSCSDCQVYGPFLNYIAYIFPSINFIMYALVYAKLIFIQLHFRNISANLFFNKRDIGMAIQFSIICLIQFGSSTFFYALPPLMHESDISFFIPMIISTLNTATNPIVMYFFQPKLRVLIPFKSTVRISSNVDWSVARRTTRF